MKKILILLVLFTSISFFSYSSILPKEKFDVLLTQKIVVFEGLKCYVNMGFWDSLDVTQKKNFCINISDTYKHYKDYELYKFYSLKDGSIIAKRTSSGYDVLK